MSSSLWDEIRKITTLSKSSSIEPLSADRSFLISILHSTTITSNSNSFLLEGRVSKGILPLSSSHNVKIYPGGHSAKISKISLAESTKDNLIKNVSKGEFVSFSLDGLDPSLLSIGSSVIQPSLSAVKISECKLLNCRIFIYPDSDALLIPGSKFLAIVYCVSGTRSYPCEIASLDSYLPNDSSFYNKTEPSPKNKNNTKLANKDKSYSNPNDTNFPTMVNFANANKTPRFLKSGESGVIGLKFQYSILVLDQFPIRILLRHNGWSIAAGFAIPNKI